MTTLNLPAILAEAEAFERAQEEVHVSVPKWQAGLDLSAKAMTSQLPAHCRAFVTEVESLRLLLADIYSGAHLYRDDGELQDSRTHPFIDFRRDSVDAIERKIFVRAMNATTGTDQ